MNMSLKKTLSENVDEKSQCLISDPAIKLQRNDLNVTIRTMQNTGLQIYVKQWINGKFK